MDCAVNSDNAHRQHYSDIDDRWQVCRQEAQTGKPQVNAPHLNNAQFCLCALILEGPRGRQTSCYVWPSGEHDIAPTSSSPR